MKEILIIFSLLLIIGFAILIANSHPTAQSGSFVDIMYECIERESLLITNDICNFSFKIVIFMTSISISGIYLTLLVILVSSKSFEEYYINKRNEQNK